MTPVLHVSQRFPASRLCAAPVIPLARHPQIDSQVIVFDLAEDPTPCSTLDAETIADRLYIRQADLPDGERRVPLKTVHTNKSPRWSLGPPARRRLRRGWPSTGTRCWRARNASARKGPALAEKVRRVFARERPAERWTSMRRSTTVSSAMATSAWSHRCAAPRRICWPKAQYAFRDARLPELLFRYRARNWPDSLLPSERERWNAYRRHRLQADNGLSEASFEQFSAEIAQLRLYYADDGTTARVARPLAGLGRRHRQALD